MIDSVTLRSAAPHHPADLAAADSRDSKISLAIFLDSAICLEPASADATPLSVDLTCVTTSRFRLKRRPRASRPRSRFLDWNIALIAVATALLQALNPVSARIAT